MFVDGNWIMVRVNISLLAQFETMPRSAMYRHVVLAMRTVATSPLASGTVDVEYATRGTTCVQVISLITDRLPDRDQNVQHIRDRQGKRYDSRLIVSTAGAAATLPHFTL